MPRSIALLGALLLALSACGDDADDKPAAPAAQGAGATATATTEPASANAGCEAAEPQTKDAKLDAPTSKLDAAKEHVVTFQTSCGDIEIELDVKGNPITASAFAYLVGEGFYDGLSFHRIASQAAQEDFVIQGGDPLGDGTGGPGFSVVEEPASDAKYTRGVVAMAKTGSEAPGTSGSQFYIVTAKDSGLPPEYAVVGKVVGGDDVVTTISKVEADPSTEAPVAPVVIKKATLKSS